MKKIILNDPETRSVDVIAENLEHLKALFPETFTDGQVDFDVLKQILGGAVDEREEKYGLHLARQAACAADRSHAKSTGTLRPCPAGQRRLGHDTEPDYRGRQPGGAQAPAEELCQKGKAHLYRPAVQHRERISSIRDNYRDNIRNYLDLTGQIDGKNRKLSSNTEASGRFHTDWLNMMYPRLKLARNLLEAEGVLLISIDDTEVPNLREVCDEILESRIFAVLLSGKRRKNLHFSIEIWVR